MNKKILASVATFTFMSISGLATATVYGSVSPALSGIDAPIGDKNDSAADLTGRNYFGVGGWSQLVKVDTPDTTATSNGYTVDITLGLLSGA